MFLPSIENGSNEGLRQGVWLSVKIHFPPYDVGNDNKKINIKCEFHCLINKFKNTRILAMHVTRNRFLSIHEMQPTHVFFRTQFNTTLRRKKFWF